MKSNTAFKCEYQRPHIEKIEYVDPVEAAEHYRNNLPPPTPREIALAAFRQIQWRFRVHKAFDRHISIAVIKTVFRLYRVAPRAIRSPAAAHARASDGGSSDDGDGEPRSNNAAPSIRKGVAI